VRPRFSVKTDGFEQWEKTFLPSREVGLLVVSTPKGIMAHKEAKDGRIGGRLLAFVY
jgi:small subunit ribosomal protein S8